MTNATPTPCTCRKLDCSVCGPRMHGATVSFMERAAKACRDRGNEAGARKAEAIIRGETEDFRRRHP